MKTTSLFSIVLIVLLLGACERNGKEPPTGLADQHSIFIQPQSFKGVYKVFDDTGHLLLAARGGKNLLLTQGQYRMVVDIDDFNFTVEANGLVKVPARTAPAGQPTPDPPAKGSLRKLLLNNVRISIDPDIYGGDYVVGADTSNGTYTITRGDTERVWLVSGLRQRIDVYGIGIGTTVFYSTGHTAFPGGDAVSPAASATFQGNVLKLNIVAVQMDPVDFDSGYYPAGRRPRLAHVPGSVGFVKDLPCFVECYGTGHNHEITFFVHANGTITNVSNTGALDVVPGNNGAPDGLRFKTCVADITSTFKGTFQIGDHFYQKPQNGKLLAHLVTQYPAFLRIYDGGEKWFTPKRDTTITLAVRDVPPKPDRSFTLTVAE